MSCSQPIPALDLGFKLNKEGQKVRDIKLLDMKHKHFGQGLEELKSFYGDMLLLLPCGKCYSCACDYARTWASRIMLEAKHHKQNCFITLTYDDFNLRSKPYKPDFQKFMKRFRKYVGWPIRFFACGECGDKSGRSHYHAIIFGYDFPDKVELQRSASGLMIYRSEILEKLWPFGISSIGDVSPESAQYVAKYSMKKKMTGYDSGEWILMSRRPGIGAMSYDENDYFTDQLWIAGKKYKMPRYFDKLAEKQNSFLQLMAKERRIAIGKSLTSKKYQLNLDREEKALKEVENQKIIKDTMKVRLSV